MRDMLFVVAGRYSEFIDYVRRNGNNTRLYRDVGSAESLRGIRGGNFITIGTWNLRSDIEDVMIQLHISGITELVTNTVRDYHVVCDTTPPKLETEDDKYLYRIGYV
jgi:hypothetical protein